MALARQLLDFELQINPTTIDLLASPAGQAQSPFVPPFSPAIAQQQLAALEAGQSTLRELEAIGSQLFAAVFSGMIHTLYERSRAMAGQQGLRIKLRLDPAFAAYPWELLRDPHDDFLALLPNVALIRYQPMPTPIKPVAVDGPLQMLVVSGHAPDLNLPREIEAIKQALAPLGSQLSIDFLEQATLDSLFNALRTKAYHILHYIGHGEPASGEQDAGLILHNADGDGALATTAALWRMLRRFESLRLIWLNACSTAVGTLANPLRSVALELVRTGVPAVIAHQQPIRDRVAVKLAATFYGSLAARLPIDVALADARAALGFQDLDSLAWAIPILFLRAADGVLFAPIEAATTLDSAPAAPAAPGLINFGQANNMQGATISFGDVGGTIIKESQHVTVRPATAAPPRPEPTSIAALRSRLAQLRQAQAALLAVQSTVPATLVAELQALEQQLADLDQSAD